MRIAGPVIGAVGLQGIRLFDVVRVGELGLVGEVIRLSEGLATIQVYEDTSGIRIGEPVISTGSPLSAQLGPGLLGKVFDGLQRPLRALANQAGDFIQRGVNAPALSEDVKWPFSPQVREGAYVAPGDLLGLVNESRTIEHRILVPPGIRGRIQEIQVGTFRVDEVVSILTVEGNRRTSDC